MPYIENFHAKLTPYFTNLNAQALHWLNHTANVRLHATTKEQPVVLFAREELTQVSSMVPYEVGLQVQRQAAWDATVRFDRSRYSIPPEHAGKPVGSILDEKKGSLLNENLHPQQLSLKTGLILPPFCREKARRLDRPRE